MPIVYTLKGDPTPLARGKIGGRYTHRHIYDSQANIRLVTGLSIKEQHGTNPPYEGPLELNAVFFFPAYKPFRKKKVTQGDWHTQVPDLSNLIKFIEDVCQDIHLYKNDSCIASIICKKYFGVQAETQFYFVELSKERTLHGPTHNIVTTEHQSNHTITNQRV